MGNLEVQRAEEIVQSRRLTWCGGARTKSLVTWLVVYCQAAGVATSMEKSDLSHGLLCKMASIVFMRGDMDISSEAS